MPVKGRIEDSDNEEASAIQAKPRANKRESVAEPPSIQDLTSKRPRRSETAANGKLLTSLENAGIDLGNLNFVELDSFSNMKYFISRLKGMEIFRIRDQAQGPGLAQGLSSILDVDVYDNRRCEYEIKIPRHASTHIADIVIHDRKKSRSFDNGGITFEVVKDLYTRDQAEEIAPILTKLLERWPCEVSQKMSQAVKWQLLMAAHMVASPNAKQRCNQEYPRQKEGKTIAYAIKIGYIDMQSGEWKGHQANVPLPTITKFDVPDVPKYCDFQPAGVGAPDAVELPAMSDISVEDQARHIAAQKICRLLGWRMHGRLFKPLDVPRLVKVYTELYGIERSGPSPQGGHLLCRLEPDPQTRHIRIVPSQAVLNGFSKPPPPVYIKSLLKRRLVPVLGQQFQEWINTGDVLKAWQSLAWAADIVNDMIMDGEPPSDPCNCYPEMASTETHPCSSCLRPTLCTSLRSNFDNIRVCQACIKKEAGMA